MAAMTNSDTDHGGPGCWMLYSWAMKQQCYLAAIYLNWLVLVSGVGYLLFTHHYGFAIAWLIALPLGMWAYFRVFPSISQAMGTARLMTSQHTMRTG